MGVVNDKIVCDGCIKTIPKDQLDCPSGHGAPPELQPAQDKLRDAIKSTEGKPIGTQTIDLKKFARDAHEEALKKAKAKKP